MGIPDSSSKDPPAVNRLWQRGFYGSGATPEPGETSHTCDPPSNVFASADAWRATCEPAGVGVRRDENSCSSTELLISGGISLGALISDDVTVRVPKGLPAAEPNIS